MRAGKKQTEILKNLLFFQLNIAPGNYLIEIKKMFIHLTLTPWSLPQTQKSRAH